MVALHNLRPDRRRYSLAGPRPSRNLIGTEVLRDAEQSTPRRFAGLATADTRTRNWDGLFLSCGVLAPPPPMAR